MRDRASRQGSYPLCMDCSRFDRAAWDFSSPNKGLCREDSAEHWIGQPACENFTCGSDSKIAAFTGGM